MTPTGQTIFVVYVLLWCCSHLLIYASRQAGAPEFNATSVVLLTELVKLCLAVGLYLRFDGGLDVLTQTVLGTLPLLVKYSVPAALYCVYNNLVYTNLTAFDPGTYNVLMQLRIVMTGIIYQQAFSKRLNRNQWIAIVLIAVGCMVKESAKMGDSASFHQNSAAWLLLLVQMLSSVGAGVYNEVLLKGGGDEGRGLVVTTNLNNAYMYFHSVVWNVAVLILQARDLPTSPHISLLPRPPTTAHGLPRPSLALRPPPCPSLTSRDHRSDDFARGVSGRP